MGWTSSTLLIININNYYYYYYFLKHTLIKLVFYRLYTCDWGSFLSQLVILNISSKFPWAWFQQQVSTIKISTSIAFWSFCLLDGRIVNSRASREHNCLARSLNLYLLYSFLWWCLKSRVYTSKLRDLNELEAAISRDLADLD